MKTPLLSIAIILILSACNPQEPVANAADPVPATATPGPAAVSPLSVVNWGQRSTPVNVPFNVQADGNSGISFELSKEAPPGDVVVTIDGKPLTGVAVGGVIVTATIPAEYLATPGSFPVVVELQPAGTRIEAGNFEVVKP